MSAPAMGDSIGAIGYNELRYPTWLSQLLVASSFAMACGAVFAVDVYLRRLLVVFPGFAGVASGLSCIVLEVSSGAGCAGLLPGR